MRDFVGPFAVISTVVKRPLPWRTEPVWTEKKLQPWDSCGICLLCALGKWMSCFLRALWENVHVLLGNLYHWLYFQETCPAPLFPVVRSHELVKRSKLCSVSTGLCATLYPPMLFSPAPSQALSTHIECFLKYVKLSGRGLECLLHYYTAPVFILTCMKSALFHWIAELERTLKGHLVQLPCSDLGHVPHGCSYIHIRIFNSENNKFWYKAPFIT